MNYLKAIPFTIFWRDIDKYAPPFGELLIRVPLSYRETNDETNMKKII